MAIIQTIDTNQGQVNLCCTDTSDGSFALSVAKEELAARRSTINPEPWTWFRQVHGNKVVEASYAGEHAGSEADGALTTIPDVPIAVLIADCAPVALVGSTGLAILHCGWRGIVEGIIERASEQLNRVGAMPMAVILGPCIYPDAYEFSEEDLKPITNQFGAAVRSVTAQGKPALDLPALVDEACQQQGWPELRAISGQATCTSGSSYFSHRTRGDRGRQTMVGWISS